MKKLKYFFTLFMLGAFISAQAYDFSSQTRYSVEEALDSVWLYYSINPDGTTVSVTQGPATYNFGNAEIPETVTYEGKTYTVTEIANSAFASSRINSIIMPNTITTIYDEAFKESSVVNVTFSKGLKKICKSAFAASSIKEAILYEGLETIDEYAFIGSWTGYYYVGKMTSLVLPTSLKYLGNYAFDGQAFNKVIIPDNITEIKDYTFSHCTNLDTVVLPKKLQSIGSYAFASCALQKIDEDFFPSTLTTIGDGAFSNNDDLEFVVLPAQIQTIGDWLFWGCDILKSVVFSSGLKALPNNVCEKCYQLIDVNIPEGITTIGDHAFYYCSRLSSIYLPESITTIGRELFAYSGLSKFTFPSKLEYVGNKMFYHCKQLSEISIPETIKRFEEDAFSECISLTSVTLPSSITEIPSGTFRNCSNIESIVLPELLKTVNGFAGCTKLKKVNIPASVETIGVSAFNGCTSLNEIELPDSLLEIGDNAFYNCKAIESMNLPKSVKTIGYQCFYGCDSLKRVDIYHNISTIVQSAFFRCSNLREVHLKKAIIPNFRHENLGDFIYIENENNCTLYVPTGSKATYEASKYWNNFDTIVEEEIGYDILYRVSASKVGQGSIAINGEAKTSVDILSGSKVGVTFTPASGWKLKSVVLNDKDVTASLVENVYEVETLEANMVFVATFEELPATLSLRSADGGSIDVAVVKGTTFSCVFTPDENWTINNVRYNNSDVTSSVSDAGEYTTPVIKNDAILSVAYETGDNSVDAISIDADMKAYVLTDGLLVVEGVEHGMPVVVYDVDGKVLSSLVAVDGRCSYQLPDAGVYVVKGVSKSIKVIF